ncbi:gas vesicle protein [Methanosarcina sp. DH2]|uniref:gas vesicle protein GvpO n=1 Tax=unclassified Methanosarcina TaxID=2644672 RepID=UPI001E47928B|nr:MULTISPECIES: gas vesicle protein GvpO [unclassified Methanosarcina]MCC4769481.1 gas vesicle protein [Methanosarcina sp. DH2]MDY9926967.1 gas vesicle protein GvpO [Methanosarcina sp.]
MEEEKNTVKEVGDKALRQIEYLLKKKGQGVVGISREGENWTVQLEVLERRAVPDTQDILGLYEMKLDTNLNILEYRRVGLRHRGDMVILDDCYIN